MHSWCSARSLRKVLSSPAARSYRTVQLIPDGSLSSQGAFHLYGSLGLYGALHLFGSLLINGALSSYGSL